MEVFDIKAIIFSDPLQVKFPNKTQIQIMFASPTILIEKEEVAYSFGFLVADCGGVLGLFIGFNFLMIWDLVYLAFITFRKKSLFKIK